MKMATADKIDRLAAWGFRREDAARLTDIRAGALIKQGTMIRRRCGWMGAMASNSVIEEALRLAAAEEAWNRQKIERVAHKHIKP